jgi:hypothetical protein
MRPSSADARRRHLLLLAASSALLPFTSPAGFAQSPKMNKRAIPSTGEMLPVVGCGT